MAPVFSSIIVLVIVGLGLYGFSILALFRSARSVESRKGRVQLLDLVEPLVLVLLSLAVAVLFHFVLMRGRYWITELPSTLAVGWYSYLARVLPQVNPDLWTVLSGVVCLMGVAVGLHVFLKWLYSASATEPCCWRKKWTLAVVGVLVLMFVAGMAFTGMVQQTTWLIRSPDPLTQDNNRIR
jgi:hypothetical protein